MPTKEEVIRTLVAMGWDPEFDLRCWTCANGQPVQPGWTCNESHEVYSVLVGAQPLTIEKP